MLIEVFINFEDLLWWIIAGIIMIILLIALVITGIISGICAFFYGKKKREKMYEEYERKFGKEVEDGTSSEIS